MEDKVFAIIMTAIISGSIIIVSTVRMLVMRGRPKPVPERALTQIEERLTRMEQAIDAVAIEMERVSEGQRFTTKLLTERSGQLLE